MSGLFCFFISEKSKARNFLIVRKFKNISELAKEKATYQNRIYFIKKMKM